MVSIIINNQELFVEDPELFKGKISTIFEPMVDLEGRASVVEEILSCIIKITKTKFIQAFKNSLLDTYTSTLPSKDQELLLSFQKFEFKNRGCSSEFNYQ